MIYFARALLTAHGLVKIGHTSGESAEPRLAALATGAGPLELLATIPGDERVEAGLHERFDDDRVHGEWFRIDVAHVLDAVDADAAVPAVPAGRLVLAGRVYQVRYEAAGRTVQETTRTGARRTAEAYLARRLAEVALGVWRPRGERRAPPRTARERLKEATAQHARELSRMEERGFRSTARRDLEHVPVDAVPEVLRYVADRVARRGVLPLALRAWLAAADAAEAGRARARVIPPVA